MRIQPQLTFNGECEKALDFYRQALGGEVRRIERYRHRVSWEVDTHKIRYAEFWFNNNRIIMSDQLEGLVVGNNITLTIETTADSGQTIFQSLARNGQVFLPYELQEFGEMTGIVKDEFGVCWNIMGKN
jgi:PhnB protein